MSFIQAIILGIVQGLTEFIPVSSSAHLIVIPWLFRWRDPGLAFDIALHIGTLIGLLWFFRADWIRLIRAGVKSITQRKIGDDLDRRLFWFLVIGTIPGAIAGYFGVPAIMVTGDEATAREAKQFFGSNCVTVAVKKGIGREVAILSHQQ